MPYIDIKDVSMFYPVKGGGREKKIVKAVNGVSLRMEKGQVLGIIGESGCGKSTLGRVLARLEQPTKGDVMIDMVSTKEMVRRHPKDFRRMVQIVFQNPFDTFTPRDTIEKIMMRPLKNHKIGNSDLARRNMCVEALKHGGLQPAEEFLKRYPHELSGGQLQRISILRSMMLNPGFIIADEPVSMLDVSVRAEIIGMLQDLSRQRNAAVVFISHDIALTRYISDHIAVMYLGRIVEYGTADEVIRTPRHPYTKALISNCASIDPDEKTAAIRITGEPPTPINPGPGCFFADRCPYAAEMCFQQYPASRDVGKGHMVACSRLEIVDK